MKMKKLFYILITLGLFILAYETIDLPMHQSFHTKVLTARRIEKLPKGVYDLTVLSGEVQLDLQPHMKKGEVYKNYLVMESGSAFPIVKGEGRVKISKAQRKYSQSNDLILTHLGNYQANHDLKPGRYLISALDQTKGERLTLTVLDAKADHLTAYAKLNKEKDTTELVIKDHQWLNIAYENKIHKPLKLKLHYIHKKRGD